MTKNRVVHFREPDSHRIACSARYRLGDVECTKDKEDVTCNNCLHTVLMKR